MDLHIDIDATKAIDFRDWCEGLTRKKPSSPLLPTHNAPNTSNNSATSPQGSVYSSIQMQNVPPVSTNTSTVTPLNATTPTGRSNTPTALTRNLYWCIDRCWSEPAQTHRRIVEDSHLQDDVSLFRALRREYVSVRGWSGQVFSWKTCQDIAFIKVRQSSRHC
jgi:hypothetical protein